jgi:26S proteasome regulatory subunit N12
MALSPDAQAAAVDYQRLEAEWGRKPTDLQKCGQLLESLKLSLTKLTFLPTSDPSSAKAELLLARNVLEIGALWSVQVKDIPSFERYMAQLKCYYFDYQSALPPSAHMYQLLGLNLLCLLSQNRVAEFHTEMELLPADQIAKNVYIIHPVSLEQWLMEGSYNKVFLSKGNVPAESYTFFIDLLLETIRKEIAECIEKAYERVSLKEAARILFLKDPKSVVDRAKSKGWLIEGQDLVFITAKKAREDSVSHIPSKELAAQAIEYAKELEMIV